MCVCKTGWAGKKIVGAQVVGQSESESFRLAYNLSEFASDPAQWHSDPCGNCSAPLQHFIAYVHGANNVTRLTGPAFKDPPTRACDCLSKEWGLLSVDPGS